MSKEKYLVIGIVITGLATFFLSGCTSFAFVCEEQSRQQLSICNTDCGEGVLSELCKSKCTIEHNIRLDKCAGNE